MSVRPAKTQISLGICPVWSESSLCAQWVAEDPSFPHATAKTLIRLGGCLGWSESSLGAQPFGWFCHVALHISRMRWLITNGLVWDLAGTRLEWREKQCISTREHLRCNIKIFGPGYAKMCLMPYTNNKGADQPAHPRSLISTFVFRC